MDADVLVIGSGMGGATVAHALAPTGARVLILERGERLEDTPATRDLSEVFAKRSFRPDESWFDGAGKPFAPGNYYLVGGNSKLYGAVLYRYRREDFEGRSHPDGDAPPWPFPYETLAPFYAEAERLFEVRGDAGPDPTEPPRSAPYPHPPIPHEPQVADAAERLRAQGLHPAPLPLAVDHEAWLKRARLPWDGLPNPRGAGKVDAETGPLESALRHPNVRLLTGVAVDRLVLDGAGRRVERVEARVAGEARTFRAGVVVLSAGAVMSAAILLRSGAANRSGVVGRHFMNHNTTAMIAGDLRRRWDTVHSKTLGLNDFYLRDDRTGWPLGNVQLLGKISAPILRANLAVPAPLRLLQWLNDRSLDWYLMSEDLPRPESRVTVDGARIGLDWRLSNLRAHEALVRRMREVFRAAGYPLILTKRFGNKVPSHQCGTVRMGTDGATSALDPWCRAHDHDNLWVVDASCLPTSAAVNPSLTVAAQALRAGRRIAASL